MNKSIKTKIRSLLEKNDKIVFALFFGSVATGRENKLSDVDIGIYFNQNVELLEIGKISAELEKITGKNIDLVLLKDLYKRKPTFANEIVKKSELIFSRDDEKYVEFKKMTLLYYLDTQPLRKKFRENLSRRIDENKLGKLNQL